MMISEIFFGIQGESTFSGLPCIFIRLAGCNLRCIYCDTSYAYEEEGYEMSIDEILKQVKRFNSKRVEITGGEPLIQKETPLLIDKLLEDCYQVLLETNGSIKLGGLDRRVIKIVDIKTPNSGFEGSFEIENLRFIDSKDEIKFVIMDKKDYQWAKGLVERNDLKTKAEVLFSPVFGRLDPKDLSQWILEDGLDVRLQPQIHKYIWGVEKNR